METGINSPRSELYGTVKRKIIVNHSLLIISIRRTFAVLFPRPMIQDIISHRHPVVLLFRITHGYCLIISRPLNEHRRKRTRIIPWETGLIDDMAQLVLRPPLTMQWISTQRKSQVLRISVIPIEVDMTGTPSRHPCLPRAQIQGWTSFHKRRQH
jgi:hypothetical protein